MRLGRARDVAAAVEIEDQPVGRGRPLLDPFAFDGTKAPGLEADTGRRRPEAVGKIGVLMAQLGDVGALHRHARLRQARETSEELTLPGRHTLYDLDPRGG